MTGTELAALKARRCDGCSWWHRFLDDLGACGSEAYATCDDDTPPSTAAGHACNAWRAAS